jgi:hypothetical protein
MGGLLYNGSRIMDFETFYLQEAVNKVAAAEDSVRAANGGSMEEIIDMALAVKKARAELHRRQRIIKYIANEQEYITVHEDRYEGALNHLNKVAQGQESTHTTVELLSACDNFRKAGAALNKAHALVEKYKKSIW